MKYPLWSPNVFFEEIDGTLIQYRVGISVLNYSDINKNKKKGENINDILKREYDRRALERTSIARAILHT